jgi:hypothetical protein
MPDPHNPLPLAGDVFFDHDAYRLCPEATSGPLARLFARVANDVLTRRGSHNEAVTLARQAVTQKIASRRRKLFERRRSPAAVQLRLF